MNLRPEDLTADNLALPSTVYTPDELNDNAIPSLAFAPGELGDLSLFLSMSALQDPADWGADDYHTRVFHSDGRVDGGMHPPEYYAYSPPRKYKWEDGLQTIKEFDWTAKDKDHEVLQDAATVETHFANDKENHTATSEKESRTYTTQSSAKTAGLTPNEPQQPPEPTSILPVPSPRIPNPRRILADSRDHHNDDRATVEAEGARTSAVQEMDHVDTEMSNVDDINIQEQHEDPITSGSGAEIDILLSTTGSAQESVPSANIKSPAPEVIPHPWQAQLEQAAAELSLEDSSEIFPAEHVKQAHSDDNISNFRVWNVQPKYSQPVLVSEQALAVPSLPLDTGAVTAEHDLPAAPVVIPPTVPLDSALSGQHAEVQQPSLEQATTPQGGLAGNPRDERMGISIALGPEKPSPPPPATMNIVMLPARTEPADTAMDLVESIAVNTTMPTESTPNPLKRATPTWATEPSGSEEEAPAKKKTKMSKSTKSAKSKSLKKEEVTVEAKPGAPAKPSTDTKCHAPNNSTKQASKEAAEGALQKPGELLFEEDVRPSETNNLPEEDFELDWVEEDVESPVDVDDPDMQEHYVTVSTPASLGKPLNVSQRAPGHSVSNRELTSLASDFVPGMHLALHQLSRPTPARAQRSSERPTKSTNADNSFNIVEKEPSEPEEAPSTVGNQKRAGTTNSSKAPASKRARIEAAKARAMRKPSPRREPSEESFAETEPEKEEEQDLFPASKLDANSNGSIAVMKRTPVPKQVTSQKARSTAKGKKKMASNASLEIQATDEHPLQLAYGNLHTRNDTKYDESKSNTSSAAISIAAQAEDEPDAAEEDLKEPQESEDEDVPEPAPTKPNKKAQPPSKPALKSRAATPALPPTNTPPKNKYGFSPRVSRTRKAPADASSTVNVAPRPTNSKDKGRSSDAARAGPVSEATLAANKKGKKAAPEFGDRKTRRTSLVQQVKKEEEEKEANIGKRLRSTDG